MSIALFPGVMIVGAGPAGLMAAEVLSQAGLAVEVIDAMPSVGRKFLRAGVGGLNITHAEPLTDFLRRYGARSARLHPWLEAFPPTAVRDWVHSLGIDTFVGSSGRVFPREMKAAPLLRAWLRRLRASGVQIQTRQRFLGWTVQGALRVATAAEERHVLPRATLLALGGGSWAQLGSDGAWGPLLQAQGVTVAPFKPANCGFEGAGWSPYLREHFAGAPVKGVSLSLNGHAPRKGEFILTAQGVEGSLIYAYSAALREAIEQNGQVHARLDLLPDRPLAAVQHALSRPRGKQSMASHLKRQLGLTGVKVALLRELSEASHNSVPAAVASAIKALPLTLLRPRPLDEAISSAGGVTFEALDNGLMLRQLPGVFCAGEMLDWEAPTGGYLLTACLATGRAAATGVLAWLAAQQTLE